MNLNIQPNAILPNLPLRKPHSSPMASILSPSSGQTPMATPAQPVSTINEPGSFLSPTSPKNTLAMRTLNTSLAHVPPAAQTVTLCNFCGQPGNFRCKRCKRTFYCSAVCQNEDWNAHRLVCKNAEPESTKVRPLELGISQVLGDKDGVHDNSELSSIQRVYMKELHSRIIREGDVQATVVEFQSPGRFFIIPQIPESLEALQIIAIELQKTYGFPIAGAHKPVLDEVCAVKYSCDMNWYRGLIRQLDVNQAHVLYIDFGNEEKVPFDRIRPLAATLQRFGPCAIECCVSGVKPVGDSWSGKCCLAIGQLLEGKTVTAKVFGAVDNGSTHAVDIVLSNGDTLSSFLLEHQYAGVIGKAPSEEDKNAMVKASMENFKRLSIGKDDNLWAQVPEPVTQAVGDSFTVVVTHIQSPEKIVVQKVDNAGIIQDLQMRLREHCSKVHVSDDFRPAPGTVCCAQFPEDKQWYRAKVLAYSSEEQVCVVYLDFGNSEDVNLKSLRPISQSLLAVPMQAMTSGLAGIRPSGESWSEECIQALQIRISNRFLRIQILGAEEGKALVNLLDETSDPQANIAELLVYAGFAAPFVDTSKDDQATETPHPPPEEQGTHDGPQAETLVWSRAELSPGTTVQLRVSCLESPGKFFCCIINSTDNQRLIELEAEMKLHIEAAASIFDPQLGKPCCAIITETDGRCFRALVKQVFEDEVLAELVDYGHSLRVKKVHLRPITPKLLAFPFRALPCWLAGVVPEGSEWTAEALLWFQTLIEGEVLSARVLSVTEDGYGVELQSKGQNVAAALVAEQLAKFSGEEGKREAATVSDNKQTENVKENQQDPPQSPPQQEHTPADGASSEVDVPSYPTDWKTVVLPINENFQPRIAAVSDPSLFYLLGPRQVGEEQIQEMMLQLTEYCKIIQPSDNSDKPGVGAACCARFPADNNWYRAVVLDVCGVDARVIYADYGNYERVSLSSILPIPARFLKLPFQIVRCSVIGKELTPVEWPDDVLQMFFGALQQRVHATVLSFDGFFHLLSLSLPQESGGGQVLTMILDALSANTPCAARPAASPLEETPSHGVPSADAKNETIQEPSLPSVIPHKIEDVTTTHEAPPPELPEPPISKLGKNTESAQADPVQRLLEDMEPPHTAAAKTREAFASSCCCESLENKIDQLYQLLQVQLSLTKQLIAQTK